MPRVKLALLWVMGLFYVVAGSMHFINTDFYLQIMPGYLPLHLSLVYLSGLCEIVLGVLVIIPAATRVAAWGLIALLIAVFPANINMAVHRIPMRSGVPPSQLGLWLRLPLQLVLIAWAWWYTKQRPVTAHRGA
ncbi:MAG: DoxX family protein [Candidatus Binatia bacterium]